MLEILCPDGSMFDAFMLQVGRDWQSAHRKFSGRKPFTRGQIDRFVPSFVKIKISTTLEFLARIFDLCTVRLDGR